MFILSLNLCESASLTLMFQDIDESLTMDFTIPTSLIFRSFSVNFTSKDFSTPVMISKLFLIFQEHGYMICMLLNFEEFNFSKLFRMISVPHSRILRWYHPFSTHSKLFGKLTFFIPLIHTRRFKHQGLRNVIFSEHFAYVLNG